MVKTYAKKITAIMTAVTIIFSMLLYFPSGTFNNISFGLKASAAEITPTEPSTDDNGVYQIRTAAQLYWFAQQVNGGKTGINAVLTADITVNTGVLKADGTLAADTSGFTSWTPMGWYDKSTNAYYMYAGTFDGQGHTISGLYFNDPSTSYVGLFGYLGSGGEIKNVGVIDSYFSGYDYVGGVCGWNIGAIKSCYNTGTVSGTGNNVGGVCGRNWIGTITSCCNTGTVSGTKYVGGVCGRNTEGGGTIDCYNTGTVTGSDYVGGVCGDNLARGTITSCCNTGTVTGSDYVGGVCGRNTEDGGTIDCYNTGEVSGGYDVGGVCGINISTITDCYNTGKVTATGEAVVVGGVCGYNYGTVTNCYYNRDKYSGNAVGVNEGTVTDVEGRPTADFTNCTVCELVGYDQLVEVNASGVYEISNACQLYWFAQQVNGGNTGINAVLTADITVNENVLNDKGELNSGAFRSWTSVGYYASSTDNHKYMGTFDGQGHTISGLYFNNPNASHVGLFGFSGGTVKNVGVIDSYFSGGMYVGGVCGYNDGTVTNCYNTGTVSGTKDYSYMGYVGGVCGYNYGGTITSCYNTGAVSGTEDYVGGVCGWNWAGTITSCYNTGTVSGKADYVGGVCGCNYKGGIITNCYNTATVSGTSYVGGVSGTNSGKITNCYYNSDKYSGSAVGDNSGTVTAVNGKTTAQFNSGVVAYLLNGSTSEGTLAWGQTIGKDDYPVLDSTKKVYRNETYEGCKGNSGDPTYSYSNTEEDPVYGEHSYDENGFCTFDDTYQPATLTTNKYDINNDNVKDEVYEISNVGQLYWFAGLVSGTLEGVTQDRAANAVLTADITVNKDVLNANGELNQGTFQEWTTIGNSTYPYRGTFDGQGHTVSGLYLNSSSTDYVGLFGGVAGSGSVSNVGVVDSYFNGNENVGGVSGYNVGKITNCYNTATVSGSNNVGGVSGYNNGKITNCYNVGIVKGTSNTGCVVGYNEDGVVSNCYYSGEESDDDNPSDIYVPSIPDISVVPPELTAPTKPGLILTNLTALTNAGTDTSGTAIEPYESIQSTSDTTVEATEDRNATCKTAEQFASGEVAYLLSQGCTINEITYDGSIWGQKIDTDPYPVLGGAKVYKLENTYCDNTTGIGYIYSNNSSNVLHRYNNNGFCTNCGAYQPAVFYETDNCYEISNAGQLYWFADYVNSGNADANAVLTADITVNTGVLKSDGTLAADTSGFTSWTPIGNIDNMYAGTFDGQNHTISGLYFNDSTAIEVGLFGGNEGKIKNVGIVDSYFSGGVYVSSVCGYNGGTITNCYNTGTITATGETVVVGGVCSGNLGTITNCYNTGTVTGNGDEAYTGGVCGINISTITDCYNTGKVTATGEDIAVGGVCGFINKGTITNCYFDSDKYSGNAVGANGGTATDVEGKTTAQFASGEVAYLLSQGCTVDEISYDGSIWGQEIGTDPYPVLNGKKVLANVDLSDFANDIIVYGQSASLDGTIGFNIYVSADDSYEWDKTVNDVQGVEIENGLYKFTYQVAAKDMDKKINFTVNDKIDVTVSVSDYLAVLSKSDNESLKNLADSMSVYGDAAKAYFSGEAVAEQTVTDDLSVYDFTLGTMPEGISYYGSSLILKSETTIRHYFKLAEGKEISDYTFSVDGMTVTPTEKQGYYCIDIKNVRAEKLGTSFNVSVNGEEVITNYSALSYVYKVMESDSTDDNLKNLVKALYIYNRNALAYINAA